MAGRARMFAGVPVWRAVTAQRHSTCLARAQMNPVRTDLHTLLAFQTLWMFDLFDCDEMRAASVNHDSFAVVMFCLVTRYVATRGSCGFRRRPFRLHQRPRRSA